MFLNIILDIFIHIILIYFILFILYFHLNFLFFINIIFLNFLFNLYDYYGCLFYELCIIQNLYLIFYFIYLFFINKIILFELIIEDFIFIFIHISHDIFYLNSFFIIISVVMFKEKSFVLIMSNFSIISVCIIS